MRTNKLIAAFVTAFCLFFLVAATASAQGFRKTPPPKPAPTATTPPAPTATNPPKPQPTGNRPPSKQPQPKGSGGGSDDESEEGGGEGGESGDSSSPPKPDKASSPMKGGEYALWAFALLGFGFGITTLALHFRSKRKVAKDIEDLEARLQPMETNYQKVLKMGKAHRTRLDALDGGGQPPQLPPAD